MEIKIGVVSHYFSRAGVAGIKITDGDLKLADEIKIKGHTTDFSQKVEEMQIENKVVVMAKTGDNVGIKVKEKTREGDIVYKVIE